MLFSVNWLKKWVGFDLSVDELAGKLTASGLEVDTVEPVAAPFSGVLWPRSQVVCNIPMLTN